MSEIIPIWDEWNEGHIARHGVTKDNVNEACHTNPIIANTHSGRIKAIARIQDGRIITVILAPQPQLNYYYVVTARVADRKERQAYRQRSEEQNG